MLRRVGFFREFYPDCADLLWMRDCMGTRRVRSEERIVRYLEAGHLLSAVMEGMRDYFDGTPFEGGSGCSSFLTDGVWLWRRDLAHYVGRYHVGLPDEFVRHLVESRFAVPELSPEELAALTAAEEQGSAATGGLCRDEPGPGRVAALADHGAAWVVVSAQVCGRCSGLGGPGDPG